MRLRMFQPGATSAIAASRTVRPARIQQSTSCMMLTDARRHSLQMRNRMNLLMTAFTVTTASFVTMILDAVAAPADPSLAAPTRTMRTTLALAVAM